MSREDARQEIENLIVTAKLQAAGILDDGRELFPRDLADVILEIAEQVRD